MKFSELYLNNKKAVERALTAMWCGESYNESQAAYIRQIKGIIGQIFAPETAVPVVQCMNSYEPVHSVSVDEAKRLVGGFWKPEYAPYEHQYQSWHTLLKQKTEEGKPMSICVTTGTGSGKTECFMLPLVYDLNGQDTHNHIQALFLYPLNALMEDQKERLEKLLAGTDLTYSVYNGDLPEKEPSEKDNSHEAELLRRRIDQIRGAYIDDETGEKRYRFSKMVYTRELVRQNPPTILLTNPTMLEYILLRKSDSNLIVPALKTLKWIVIDETHTYTGAGAAELAMLLRRVLLAFNVNAEDIRFATSSATFGNAETEEEKAKANDELRSFIAGITGLPANQVKVIGGKRIGEDSIPNNPDAPLWDKIFKSDFIALDELFPEPTPIPDKLRILDDICSREEQRAIENGSSAPEMKVKVHYFYRVPNNGFYVRLSEGEDGAFKIHTQNSIDTPPENAAPLLELSRCKHCGEYVAVAMLDPETGEYEPLASEDTDMFDLVQEENPSSGKKLAIFGLSNTGNARGDNNVKFGIEDGKLLPLLPGDRSLSENGGWHIVGNTQCCCPYCNSRLARKPDAESASLDVDAMAGADVRLQKFRLSSDFIARLLAPSVLDQLDHGKSKEESRIVLHNGQQYISFVDSRQAAAKSTLKQNLEQERMWFYSTIYHELCKRAKGNAVLQQEIGELIQQIGGMEVGSEEWQEACVKLKEKKDLAKKYMTWGEISDLLLNDDYCPLFCSLFVKRSGDSDELDEDGHIKPSVLKQYVQSIMVMYLAGHPASAAAPETMGLFHTYYPKLESVPVPDEVKTFNDVINHPSNKINKEDWHNYLQLFLDYSVRTNQSIFLRLSETNRIDIFSSVRFATEKPRRRPVTKPQFEEGHLSQSRFVRFLGALIARDNPSLTVNDALLKYHAQIAGVIDAFWRDLTEGDNCLLEQGTNWDEDSQRHVLDRNDSRRLNLANVCIKLYEDVYLCDTNSDGDGRRHTECLRPIGVNFKRFAPYMDGGNPVELDESVHEHWSPYPYYKGCGVHLTPAALKEWAKTNRAILWNNQLWGEDGVFSDRLEDIHLYPDLFIQAEHTAQVDKVVSRKRQSEFKDHAINILACSTTMEMGVDLGDLEVVMLTSVPPQPSNYKQRAGRSGRNNKVRSACITLCGSDAIGLRTLYSPLERIINRVVKVPTVDLLSPQVVQRHINSYLIRSLGIFSSGTHGGSLNQKVVDYYTPFSIKLSAGRLEIIDKNNGTVDPSRGLGDPAGTLYGLFNEKCSKPLPDEINEGLATLLKNTVFEGHVDDVVKNAQKDNKRCYAELGMRIEDYATAFRGSGVTQKFRTKLKMQYMEVLNDRLLNYWATSRFIPNANMPVNVLTLDLNSDTKDFFTPVTSSNPSYSLREAIAQYAPGNCIVVDGVVYIVRGIEFTNMYQGVRSFKQIYRNTEKTVIDDATAVSSKIPWFVNGKEGLELIQPISFIPDLNEDKSRIIDSNTFTRVSAQLIDANAWQNNVTITHLYEVRCNRETGNAKILYYNEGKGYGYCFCTRCGRMVLEDEAAASSDHPERLPYEMNPIAPRDPDKPRFHFAIGGKDVRKPCPGSHNAECLRRNVIIGDLIQTDYSEIRFRHNGMNSWIRVRDEEEKMLFTLGIAFTQTLTEILGKERDAIDFAIMPNGHICIFDTNPGGAGYANQLVKEDLMHDVLLASKDLLEQAKAKNSKDFLLDKFTLRYIKYIDLDAALSWIAEELG